MNDVKTAIYKRGCWLDRVLHLLLSREHLGRCGWWTGVCVCAVHVHGWPQCDHTLPWMEECVVTTAVEELQHPPVRFAWCVQRPQTGGSRCETRLKRACSMYPYRRTSRRTAVTSTARAKYPAAPKQPGFHILFLLSNLTRKTTLWENNCFWCCCCCTASLLSAAELRWASGANSACYLN